MHSADRPAHDTVRAEAEDADRAKQEREAWTAAVTGVIFTIARPPQTALTTPAAVAAEELREDPARVSPAQKEARGSSSSGRQDKEDRMGLNIIDIASWQSGIDLQAVFE
jgi:hypothetical protein